MRATSFPMGRILFFAAALLCVAAPVPARDEKDLAAGSKVDMQWGAKVPMRDGTLLNATIYRPRGQKY